MLKEFTIHPTYVRQLKEISWDSTQYIFRIGKGVYFNEEAIQGSRIIEKKADGFFKAKSELAEMIKNHQNPFVILLDVPYSKKKIISFIDWLNKSATFQRIPILYNKSILTREEIKELQNLNLVDDILDIRSDFEILPAKCKFLLKVKDRQFQNKGFKLVSLITVVNKVIQKTDFFLRRSFNIVVSLLLLTVLSPVLLLITLAIKLESRGPVIYISPRAGRGYKVFKFYKFRTMYVNADEKRKELEKQNLYNNQNITAQFFKIKNDPRITRLGAFLRNTSLDELPQLFNVLKGDMSIVGNRPLPLYEAVTLTTDEWAQRFMAPAGITGLWQIKKRGREDMSVVERINLDISYARNNGFLKDLMILAKTPTAMFQKTNV